MVRDAWLGHAREWRDKKTGPLPSPDALLARILHSGQWVQDRSHILEPIKFMSAKVGHWHTMAKLIPSDHIKHAHFLRLLEKFAEFREDQAAVEAAAEKLRAASAPAADNDRLAAHHIQVWRQHLLRKQRKAEEAKARVAAANEKERQRALRAAQEAGEVTRPASPNMMGPPPCH